MDDSNRMRILQAADELFNARGYKSVTIRDLAERLGMSKKTIYQYFSGKEEIASEVMEHVMGRIVEKFDRLEKSGPGENPLAEIRETFKQVKAEIARVSPLFREDIRKLLPQLNQRIKDVRAERIRKIEFCIRAAQQKGLAKATIDARLATLVLLASLQGLSSSSDLFQQEFSKFDALDAVIEIFVSGITNTGNTSTRITNTGNTSTGNTNTGNAETEVAPNRVPPTTQEKG
jgi:AcrR family transcriptional regulator